MRINKTFLLISLLAYPMIAGAEEATISQLKDNILAATTLTDAKNALIEAISAVNAYSKYTSVSETTKEEAEKIKTDAINSVESNDSTDEKDENESDEYKKAKENEQSTANKTLTALTTAATGIGGMELAMGLSQQKADKDADAAMDAYIQTFRCSYGEGKQVKAGPEEIELPGGNDAELMKLRAEYVALAADLKERKNALGMKPGIEAEEIMDKATMGLYDDENVGITGGNYASRYRAKMLGSESDQQKLDADKKEAKNRIIAGGVLAAAGVVGGIIGNSAINGKLAEKIKEAKTKKEIGTETEKALKIESDALEDLQQCLDDAGVNGTDTLSFSKFYISALSFKNIDCERDLSALKGKSANDLFTDSDDMSAVFDTLVDSFGSSVVSKMLGLTLTNPPTAAEKTRAIDLLTKKQAEALKRIEDANEKDGTSNKSSLSSLVSSETLGTVVGAVSSVKNK